MVLRYFWISEIKKGTLSPFFYFIKCCSWLITISEVIDVWHSNCLFVPLWSGHQFQSPLSNLKLGLFQHPLQTFLFVILTVLDVNSWFDSVKLLIITTGFPNAQANQLNPLDNPIKNSL